jgi:hypothetical protein
MVATGECSLAIPSGWHDATSDTADIGRLKRASTVALLLGHDALGESRGLNDVRAAISARVVADSPPADGQMVSPPRQEFSPC